MDRFSFYLIRQLKTAVMNSRIIREIGLENARAYRLVTKSVERTADHAASIADNILSLKKRVHEETVDKREMMSSLAMSVFETAFESRRVFEELQSTPAM